MVLDWNKCTLDLSSSQILNKVWCWPSTVIDIDGVNVGLVLLFYGQK